MPAGSADVVIIGGGVTGASVAYHLAVRGVRNIVVLERDSLGAGSTSRNHGGVRQQFSTEVNVRLSQRSVQHFLRFKEEMGVDPAFQQVGYLFLITEERDVEPFERSLALWERLGVPARRIGAADARELLPELVVDDVRFATYSAEDGVVDPWSILTGYVSRARALGVTFREGVRVTGIAVKGGRVTAVRAGDEVIPCALAVNAAGPWAREVGRFAGADIPVSPMRRQVFATHVVPQLARPFPFTFEFASGLSIRGETTSVLLSMSDRSERSGFDDAVNWSFLPSVIERAVARMPILEAASIRRGWAGLYEDTPDRHVIIGPIEGVEGFICAAGSSGHGLMHSPAIGETVAELIADGRTTLDVSPLHPARFRTGALLTEHTVIE